ncbi:MAG TPA: DUF6807 family protein [Phycisphaerae bacterium]|nr:DUF6807 family protein [Phycisphaerae bacterium]
MNHQALTVRHTWGRSIGFHFGGSAAGGAYRFEEGLPKPCFHPLVTGKGHVVTLFEPSDHAWHRGLWFTIKFINGTNFWEEQAPFGVQRSASEPHARMTGPASLAIEHALQWTSEATGPVVDERREIEIRGTDGGMEIDWSSELLALQDLTLDRTPFTTWGGYSGLTFRASRELHQAEYLLPSGEKKQPLLGEPHEWVALQARVDGGPEEYVTVAMVDHPENPRAPLPEQPADRRMTPWYGKADPYYVFYNAAFMFHSGMQVRRGERLRFRYRVLIQDGLASSEAVGALAAEFRGGNR